MRRLERQPNGCLEWQGYRNRGGYGTIFIAGKCVTTHRFAWGLAHPGEPLPPVVRHFVCDNPPCCDPEHLRPGTNADNSADMVAKGRVKSGVGAYQAAKTHCPDGHPYDDANTIVYNGKRYCRACRTPRQAAYRLRQKSAKRAETESR